MKKLTFLLALIAILAFTSSGATQGLEYKMLSEVNLDSLTGVANDIDTVKVTITQKGVYPEFIIHIMEIEADINTGEGFVYRHSFGIGAARVTNSALDTLTSLATGGFIKFYDTTAASNGGTSYEYSLQELASAANTDTLSYSSYVIAVYKKTGDLSIF